MQRDYTIRNNLSLLMWILIFASILYIVIRV